MSKGLDVIREHIRHSFLQVHNDRRSREERLADQELHSAIAQSPAVKNDSTEKRISAYISAALCSEHIRKHAPQRDHRWLIEEPAEGTDAVIALVVRHLEQR